MRMVGASIAVAICLVWAHSAVAQSCGSGNCSRKGNCGSCGKSCQVTCGTKTVKKTVWVVECEEFCALLPNCDRCRSCNRGCKSGRNSGCESDACGDCGGGCDRCCKDPCEALKNRKYVPPKCSKVRSRKKLVKKTVTCEVPVYKCVLCGGDAGCGAEVIEEGAAPPEAPSDAAPEVPPPAPQASTGYAPQPPVVSTSYLMRIRQ